MSLKNDQPIVGDYVRVRRRRDKVIMCNFGRVDRVSLPQVSVGPVRFYIWHGDQMHTYNSNDHEVTI